MEKNKLEKSAGLVPKQSNLNFRTDEELRESAVKKGYQNLDEEEADFIMRQRQDDAEGRKTTRGTH